MLTHELPAQVAAALCTLPSNGISSHTFGRHVTCATAMAELGMQARQIFTAMATDKGTHGDDAASRESWAESARALEVAIRMVDPLKIHTASWVRRSNQSSHLCACLLSCH